jgi:hypothetical protein
VLELTGDAASGGLSIPLCFIRLQHRRAIFDEVAALSVEGVNKSAVARVKGIVWNTVRRWLARAADWCRRFNDRRIDGLSGVELQADEIRTIVGGKEQPIWVVVELHTKTLLNE